MDQSINLPENDWGARSSSKKLLFLACENSNSNPLSLPRSVAGGLHNSPRSAEMPRVVKVVNDFPIEEGKEHNLSAGCDTQFVWIDEWQRPQTHLNRTHRSCLSLSKYKLADSNAWGHAICGNRCQSFLRNELTFSLLRHHLLHAMPEFVVWPSVSHKQDHKTCKTFAEARQEWSRQISGREPEVNH